MQEYTIVKYGNYYIYIYTHEKFKKNLTKQGWPVSLSIWIWAGSVAALTNRIWQKWHLPMSRPRPKENSSFHFLSLRTLSLRAPSHHGRLMTTLRLLCWRGHWRCAAWLSLLRLAFQSCLLKFLMLKRSCIGPSGTVECHYMTSVNAMWSRRIASGILPQNLTY